MIISVLFYFLSLYQQQCDDSVMCLKYDVIFCLDGLNYECYHEHIDDGDIYSYLFRNDNIVIESSCTFNVKRPSMTNAVISRDTVLVNERSVYRTVGKEKDNRGFWQEDVYINFPLKIKIRYASKENFDVYQDILNKVEFALKN
jgi:hypothetical protein